jgi:hypothetical protein
MPQTVGQGGTIPLDAEFKDGSGTMVDPDTPQVDIIDPADTTVVSNATPVRDGLGRYHYNYAVPTGAPLGVWTAHWTGTINGAGVGADDHFTVTAPGGIGFEPGSLVTADEVLALAGVTLDDTKKEALADQLADWTAELEERLNRPLTQKVVTGERVRADSSGNLWTKWAPIISITGIRLADTGSSQISGSFVQYGGAISSGSGGVGAMSYTPGTEYLVDYTAGLSEDAARPARSILKARGARLAVKMADDAYGVSSLSQEGYSAPYLDEGWTEQELLNVDRRRRRVVRTG